jgi:hypothetical protein
LGCKMTTLQEAQEQFNDAIHSTGMRCPCCQRWGKVYGYGVSASMSRALIWLYGKAGDGSWVNIQTESPAWVLRTKTLSTLKHWGLIERKVKDDDADVKHSGIWRITTSGVLFVRKRLTVPKKVYVFDDMVQGYSKEHVDIVDCLGKKFSYSELMKSRMEM